MRVGGLGVASRAAANDLLGGDDEDDEDGGGESAAMSIFNGLSAVSGHLSR